ncbi:MAG: hypothetical protein ACE3L7_00300 [Candidatus Pristimantibacillus sp.]
MIELDIIKDEEIYGVRMYVVRKKTVLNRHRMNYIDLQSIADNAELSLRKLIEIIDYDLGLKQAIDFVVYPSGDRKVAIRAKRTPILFKLLNVVSSGNENILAAKKIVASAIELMLPEEGGQNE